MYCFAYHFARCFNNWSFVSLYRSNYRVSKFEFLDVGKCLPIYLGVPSYLLFFLRFVFCLSTAAFTVMFLQFMGVETNSICFAHF